jgi:hypothetical protein
VVVPPTIDSLGVLSPCTEMGTLEFVGGGFLGKQGSMGKGIGIEVRRLLNGVLV